MSEIEPILGVDREMKLVPVRTAGRCCEGLEFVEIGKRITERSRILVCYFVIPKVGIVAERTQEIILVEYRSSDIRKRLIGCRIGTRSGRYTAVLKIAGRKGWSGSMPLTASEAASMFAPSKALT